MATYLLTYLLSYLSASSSLRIKSSNILRA